MKLGISKIKKKWNDQVQSGAWKKNLPVNYKLTARSRFTSDKTNEEITGKKREYFKHLQNYVYANYIRKERNSQGMSVSNLAHHVKVI